MADEEKIRRFQDQAVELSNAMKQRLGPEFFEQDGDQEVRVGLFEIPFFGEAVAFDVDELLYTLAADELVAIRSHGGRTEWAYIDEHGEPDEWRRQAPAPGQAEQN